jgi:hypothetical protein
MITKKEVHYSDMSEMELEFLFDALKYRLAEAEHRAEVLDGKLARFKVMQYMGTVQNAN